MVLPYEANPCAVPWILGANFTEYAGQISHPADWISDLFETEFGPNSDFLETEIMDSLLQCPDYIGQIRPTVGQIRGTLDQVCRSSWPTRIVLNHDRRGMRFR